MSLIDGMTAELHELATESLRLALTLSEAQCIQWAASPRPPTKRDPTGRRLRGQISDPTARVALDERRLAVREKVDAAARTLEAARHAVRNAGAEIAAAIACAEEDTE